jgi:hypothetical protein
MSSDPNSLILRRQISLAADLGDDDDMREELGRLSVAQIELQKELLDLMKTVETMQNIEDDEHEEAAWPKDDRETVISADDEGSVEVEEDFSGGPTPKPFSEGFFELIKPQESLESQKKRQLEIVQENLHSIQPGLDAVADCQRQTQEAIVKKRIQMEELRVQNHAKLEQLLQSKPRTLEEEKERQKRILELSLDPELVQKLEREREAQGIILEKKQKELEATKELAREKMKDLAITKTKDRREDNRFWSAPRKHFEAMLGRKKVDQIERSTRHLNTGVR